MPEILSRTTFYGETCADLVLSNLEPAEQEEIVLPAFVNEVNAISKPKFKENKHGVLEHRMVTMSDGTKYETVMGVPSCGASDLAVVSTPPLGIPTQHIHNAQTIDDLMSMDFPVIMVGPPRGWRANTSPANNAHDMHQILDQVLPWLEVDSERLLAVGGSRGGIVGLGLCVPRYAGTRKVIYADLVSPCGPRPPEGQEWSKVLAYIPEVGQKLGCQAVKNALKGDLSSFANLISSDPAQGLNSTKFFLNVALSGIAGKMAKASDPQVHMHIQLFEGDTWAPIDDWSAAFKGRQNVKICVQHGGHENVASVRTRIDIAERFAALREAGGHIKTLKHSEYLKIMRAHMPAKEQIPETDDLPFARAA